MSGMAPIDLESLRAWIGRTDAACDTVTPRLVSQFNATFDKDTGTPEVGAGAPLTIHWCLAPFAAGTSLLGADGHPMRGGFLPPVPLPRRMWASSAVEFMDHLRAGDPVERRSSISDVTVKEGRSGTLCFVTVNHEIITSRGPALLEQQNIVYSGIAKAADAIVPTTRAQAQWRRDGKANPVLLFRYSALTFNSHRIHYDRSYATEVELYPGLVVHGPLQATLLVEFAAQIKNKPPRAYKFRGVRPLYDFMSFHLCANEVENGLNLWIETTDGIQTMDMEASW